VIGDVRFTVELEWHGLIAFYRDRGCSRGAVVAICHAIVAHRPSVHDVTPVAVDAANAAGASDSGWDDRTLRFTARQVVGGVIQVERHVGCERKDVLDLCDAILDEPDLSELDDTNHRRRGLLAG
jgi:hypothetical protein